MVYKKKFLNKKVLNKKKYFSNKKSYTFNIQKKKHFAKKVLSQ
jgi:hypothetical protein